MADTPLRSPLAPEQFPTLPLIRGVSFAAIEAGVRYSGRTDVMLAQLAPGSAVAGVFTRSSTRAAPVLDCQAKIGSESEAGAAIIVNSGNANAFTGKNGIEATKAVTSVVATTLNLPETRVFSSSTGVIGEPLAHDRITSKIVELQAILDEGAIESAAEAIRTTDTFAKGSGMIAPDMATMLVYIFTDAKIAQSDLQAMVSGLNEVTFNAITVDSDTSTSDSLLIGATGASGVDVAGNADFRAALHSVMKDLALQVVRDGEGATKLIEIQVTGATSDKDARTHGLSIANSPLVKTAIAGEDPNWGRVVMAVGKSGAPADRDLLSISFGDVLVADKGWVSPEYREADGAAYMKNAELILKVDLGLGDGRSTVWTCDLTHGYITINADYRS